MGSRSLLAILLVAGLVQVAATEARAQSMPVLGYVANENVNPARLAIFKKGLADLGYAEGKSVVIEYRSAKLDLDYPRLVAELIGRRVDIIVAANAPAAVAAKKATDTVPIVIAAVNDPVGLGLVKSLARPGTNVTGTTMYAPHLIGERVRLLKKLVPAATNVAMFTNGNNANNPAQFALFGSEARAVGIQAAQIDVRTPPEVEPAFSKAGKEGAQGLFQAVNSFMNSQRAVLARLAAQAKLPMIFTDREYVLAGGLMSIGPGHQEGYEGAAGYVNKFSAAQIRPTCRWRRPRKWTSRSAGRRLPESAWRYRWT